MPSSEAHKRRWSYCRVEKALPANKERGLLPKEGITLSSHGLPPNVLFCWTLLMNRLQSVSLSPSSSWATTTFGTASGLPGAMLAPKATFTGGTSGLPGLHLIRSSRFCEGFRVFFRTNDSEKCVKNSIYMVKLVTLRLFTHINEILAKSHL